jgi:predicted ATPase
VIGYLRLLQLPVPRHMEEAANLYRYNRRVFIAPPWREIFANDIERKQDFDESVRTYESMVATYREYGYELITLPLASVQERVRSVLEIVKPDVR